MNNRGRPREYTPDERRRMRLRVRAGWSHRQVAAEFGCSPATVSRIITSSPEGDARTYTPKPNRQSPNDPDLPGELWRDIPGYEGYYQASDQGRVRRIRSRGGKSIRRVLKINNTNAGYHQYQLSREGKRQHYSGHQLIYRTFIGEIGPGLEIDHINRDRGDNRPENLRLLTRKQNMQYRRKKGADHHMAKLTWEEVAEIRALAPSPRISMTHLAKVYGVSVSTICSVVNRKAYIKESH